MLYADEVLTGLGRTGYAWGCDHEKIVPDAVMVGKALGSGIPISAVVGQTSIMDSAPVSHPLTVAAAPVPARAALETLDVIEDEGLIENARVVGKKAIAHIMDESEARPRVGNVRGRGLLIGIEVVAKDGHTPDAEYAARVCAEAYRRGLFLFAMGVYGNALRVNPPLCITDGEMEQGISLLCEALDAAL
jgi:4-aminobutyrate aminotransferase